MVNRVPLNLETDPRDNLYAFGKTWGTLSEDPVVSTFHGAMYGSVGSRRLVPLFGYAGTGITKCRFVDDDTLQMRGKETGFFYDLATHEIIDTWDNPFTGETVEVYHFLNDRIGGELTTEMPRLHVGDDPEHGVHMNENIDSAAAGDPGTRPFVLPWAAYGDELLLEWDYAHEYPNPVAPTKWPKASTGPVINPSEHFVMYVSKAELEDRDLVSAHFRGGFSRISPWWPWMRMGGSGLEDGKMMGRMHSRKTINGLDDVPPKLLARTLDQAPQFLEAPTDWEMGPILSSWEAFARDVPPEV